MNAHCPHCGQPILPKGLSAEAINDLAFMTQQAPKRGGFMFEGARVSYDKGLYHDAAIAELLAAGLIAPHEDPEKGWVVVK